MNPSSLGASSEIEGSEFFDTSIDLDGESYKEISSFIDQLKVEFGKLNEEEQKKVSEFIREANEKSFSEIMTVFLKEKKQADLLPGTSKIIEKWVISKGIKGWAMLRDMSVFDRQALSPLSALIESVDKFSCRDVDVWKFIISHVFVSKYFIISDSLFKKFKELAEIVGGRFIIQSCVDNLHLSAILDFLQRNAVVSDEENVLDPLIDEFLKIFKSKSQLFPQDYSHALWRILVLLQIMPSKKEEGLGENVCNEKLLGFIVNAKLQERRIQNLQERRIQNSYDDDTRVITSLMNRSEVFSHLGSNALIAACEAVKAYHKDHSEDEEDLDPSEYANLVRSLWDSRDELDYLKDSDEQQKFRHYMTNNDIKDKDKVVVRNGIVGEVNGIPENIGHNGESDGYPEAEGAQVPPLSLVEAKLKKGYERVISDSLGEEVPHSDEKIVLTEEEIAYMEQAGEEGIVSVVAKNIIGRKFPELDNEKVSKILCSGPVVKVLGSVGRVHKDASTLDMLSDGINDGVLKIDQCIPILMDILDAHPYIWDALQKKHTSDIAVYKSELTEKVPSANPVFEHISKIQVLLMFLIQDKVEGQSNFISTMSVAMHRQKEENSSLSRYMKDVLISAASASVGASFGNNFENMAENMTEAALEIITDSDEIGTIADKFQHVAVPIDLEFVNEDDRESVMKFFHSVCGEKSFYDLADIERVISVNNLLKDKDKDVDICDKLGIVAPANDDPNSVSFNTFVLGVETQIQILHTLNTSSASSSSIVSLLTDDQESKLKRFAKKAATNVAGLAATVAFGPAVAAAGSIAGLGYLLFSKKNQKK